MAHPLALTLETDEAMEAVRDVAGGTARPLDSFDDSFDGAVSSSEWSAVAADCLLGAEPSDLT